MNKTDSQIIDELGGTSAVAELCQVSSPSVSEWRHAGIPRARRMYLELLRPDVFRAKTAGASRAVAVEPERIAA
jgi:hypothetical protein